MCSVFFVGISKFKTIAKIKNEISKISSHVSWAYNTFLSHDSDMTKSKMLSNFTLFWEFSDKHILSCHYNVITMSLQCHFNVMTMSFPTKDESEYIEALLISAIGKGVDAFDAKSLLASKHLKSMLMLDDHLLFLKTSHILPQ